MILNCIKNISKLYQYKHAWNAIRGTQFQRTKLNALICDAEKDTAYGTWTLCVSLNGVINKRFDKRHIWMDRREIKNNGLVITYSILSRIIRKV